MAKIKPARPRLNRAHPLARGLVGAWPFWERGGTVVRDLGPYKLNGTLTNGPTWTRSPLGPAVDFDGSNDYVALGTQSALDITGTQLTIAGWIRRDVTATFGIIFARQNATVQHQLAWASSADATNPNKARLLLDFGTGNVVFAGSTAHTDTTGWHHVAATYDGANVRIYFDGVLESTTPETRSIASFSYPAYIAGNAVAAFTDGKVADSRIWRRALTPDEVRSLYSDPWGLYRPRRTTFPIGAVGYVAPAPVIATPSTIEVYVDLQTPDYGGPITSVIATPSTIEIYVDPQTPLFSGTASPLLTITNQVPEPGAENVWGDELVEFDLVGSVNNATVTFEVDGAAREVNVGTIVGGAHGSAWVPFGRGTTHMVTVTAEATSAPGTVYTFTWSFETQRWGGETTALLSGFTPSPFLARGAGAGVVPVRAIARALLSGAAIGGGIERFTRALLLGQVLAASDELNYFRGQFLGLVAIRFVAEIVTAAALAGPQETDTVGASAVISSRQPLDAIPAGARVATDGPVDTIGASADAKGDLVEPIVPAAAVVGPPVVDTVGSGAQVIGVKSGARVKVDNPSTEYVEDTRSA